MDSEKQKLFKAHLDGELSPKQAKDIICLCRKDPAFRAALVDESIFSQQIHIALQQLNAQEQSSDFAAACVDSVLSAAPPDLAVRRGGKHRNYWKPLALAASLLLALGVYGFLYYSGQSSTPAPLARVVTVSPGVIIQHNGRSIPAKTGALLYPQDKLLTGKRQRAVLTHSTHGSKFELGENSSFTLKNALLARLEQGRIKANLPSEKLKRAFVLKTPHAVATVVGTRLSLTVKKQSSRLDVYRGLVGYLAFHDKNEKVLDVGENQYAVAEPGMEMAVLPFGVDYESFSSLRRIYRDETVVFKDDFEQGNKNWLPIGIVEPASRKKDTEPGVQKKASEVPTNCVDIINSIDNGNKTRILRIDNNAADELMYGVWNRYSGSPRSYSVEMKLRRSDITANGNIDFRGVFKTYKTPSGEDAVNMLPTMPDTASIPNNWVDARFEYIIEPENGQNSLLDKKIFFDGKLNSWTQTKGSHNQFGGEILILADKGGIMMDDVVVRRMVPKRVTEGLLALYKFDEGKGTVVKDVSGIGEPSNMAIGKPASVNWLPRGLAVKQRAGIKSDSAPKIAQAWRRSGELTIELWVKPFLDKPDQRKPSSIIALKSNHGRLNYKQVIPPDKKTTPSTPLHYVLTLSKEDKRVQARFFQDSEQAPKEPQDRQKNGKESGGSHSVNEVSLAIRSADRVFARNSLRLILQGSKPSGHTWQGEYHLLAVYGRVLTTREIWRNHLAGPVIYPGMATEKLQVVQASGEP